MFIILFLICLLGFSCKVDKFLGDSHSNSRLQTSGVDSDSDSGIDSDLKIRIQSRQVCYSTAGP